MMDESELSLNAELQRQTFNRLAQNWDEEVEHNKRLINAILEITALGVGERILDLAGGTGVLIPHLLDYNPAEITLLDVSERMLEKAEDKYSTAQNIKFVNDDFYHFKSRDKFDYIICFDAYPHFVDRNAFVRKLSELTAEDGRFVICHDQSRERINKRHKKASVISSEIEEIEREAKLFRRDFDIDVMVDTDKVFILSGVKPVSLRTHQNFYHV